MGHIDSKNIEEMSEKEKVVEALIAACDAITESNNIKITIRDYADALHPHVVALVATVKQALEYKLRPVAAPGLFMLAALSNRSRYYFIN